MDLNSQKAGIIHVVAAIVWHPLESNRFLISRRPEGKHLENYWELPGGKREAKESAARALARELEEEVNIRDIIAEPFMQVTHHYVERSILLDVWQVTSFSGDAIGREGQRICWVSVDRIGDYRFPDADRPVLEAIVNSVKA